MKMSSCGSGLEGSSVAQHRPQDVDPPASESDEGLGVPLALSPLAVVEGSGLRRATQAGKRRLVEDPLEDLVATTHPAVVANPLAGVFGDWHKTGVGGELIGARGSGKVSCGDQELGPEDRTHAGQASENPGLGTGEKTLLKLPVERLNALLESERFVSKLGDDPDGDAFSWQRDALGSCGLKSLPSDALSSFDAALFEEAGETREAHSADGGRCLVVANQSEGTPVVEVQRPPKSRKEGQQGVSETVDGAGLVGDEISAAGEQELQFGQISFAGSESCEIGPHPSLIGDDISVAGIGLGLSGIGVASSLHGKAWKIEDPLRSFPQQRQQECCATSGLVNSPNGFLREGEDLVDEKGEIRLVIFHLSGEDLRSRSVEHVNPVDLFAGIDARPHLSHDHLRVSVAGDSSPMEDPADSSLCSESASLISISGQSLHRGRGAIFPSSHQTAENTKPSSAPLGVTQELYPDNTQKDKEDKLSEEQKAYLGRLCDLNPALTKARRLTQDFAKMVRDLEGEKLDGWLKEAEACGAPAMLNFAAGLRKDLTAVRAGLTETWSNGPVEGFIHKLKLLKRQGYGRAGFDLLKARMLAA
jgi:Transposase